MRKLLLGSAAITFSTVLSGCSFLGMGGNNTPSSGYYGPTTTVNAAPKACGTSQCLSRWNLEGGLGVSAGVGNDLVTGDQAHNFTIDAAGNQVANTNQINNISYKDAYDLGYRAELGGSYAVSPNTKVSLLGFIDEAESDGSVNWGTVNGQTLTGALSDYKSYGAELGLRQYFSPRKGVILNSIRPYIEGRAGLSQVEAISVENSQLGGATFSAQPIGFTRDSLVGSAAGLLGVETPLTRYSTIGLETGIRYQGGLKSDTASIGPGSPLAGTNNSEGRWSVPLTLRGRYRF